MTPGISAGIGGLAQAGIPVTHRDVNQAVTFVTGHDQTGTAPTAVNWAALAKGSPVIVIYMAIKHLDRIADELIAAGRARDEPLAIVSNATLPDMTVLETTLGRAAADAKIAGIGAPAIICLGRVVSLRQAIDWVGQLRGEVPRNLDPLGILWPVRRAVTTPAIILAAPASGAGKTVLSLGLMRALRHRGLTVRAAKSGPDYIDPAFHAAATGAPSVNLDAWAMDPDSLPRPRRGPGR